MSKDKKLDIARIRGKYVEPVSESVAEIQDKINEVSFDIKDFQKYVVNGDWTPAFHEAQNQLPSLGGTIQFSEDVTIKTPIIFTKKINLVGTGYSSNFNTISRPKGSILKDGNFSGITLSKSGSTITNVHIEGISGNGGNGIVVGAGRCTLENVSSHLHGGDGIRIGGELGENCNLWRAINIYTLANTGNGFTVKDTLNPTLPNVNSGVLIGLDTRSNLGDGLNVQNAIDCGFYSVCSQQNSQKGIRLMSKASGHQFYTPYTENNTIAEFELETGSSQNYVFGYRTANFDAITNNGTDNFILGRDNQTTLGNVPYLKTYLQLTKIGIKSPQISGVWVNEVDGATRDLVIKLMSTSSTGKVIFKHDVGGNLVTTVHDQIQIGGGAIITKHLFASGTKDFPSIPAFSTAELTLSVPGALVGYSALVYPSGIPEAGLTWCGYVSATDTVTIRLANVTNAAINPAPLAWRADVWGHTF